jgi:hypothetical protein
MRRPFSRFCQGQSLGRPRRARNGPGPTHTVSLWGRSRKTGDDAALNRIVKLMLKDNWPRRRPIEDPPPPRGSIRAQHLRSTQTRDRTLRRPHRCPQQRWLRGSAQGCDVPNHRHDNPVAYEAVGEFGETRRVEDLPHERVFAVVDLMALLALPDASAPSSRPGRRNASTRPRSADQVEANERPVDEELHSRSLRSSPSARRAATSCWARHAGAQSK